MRALRQSGTGGLASMGIGGSVALNLALPAGNGKRNELDGDQNDGKVDGGMAGAAEGREPGGRAGRREMAPAAAPAGESVFGG